MNQTNTSRPQIHQCLRLVLVLAQETGQRATGLQQRHRSFLLQQLRQVLLTRAGYSASRQDFHRFFHGRDFVAAQFGTRFEVGALISVFLSNFKPPTSPVQEWSNHRLDSSQADFTPEKYAGRYRLNGKWTFLFASRDQIPVVCLRILQSGGWIGRISVGLGCGLVFLTRDAWQKRNWGKAERLDLDKNQGKIPENYLIQLFALLSHKYNIISITSLWTRVFQVINLN